MPAASPSHVDEDLSIEEHLAAAAEHVDEASKKLDEDDLAQEDLTDIIRALEACHDGFEGKPVDPVDVEIRP